MSFVSHFLLQSTAFLLCIILLATVIPLTIIGVTPLLIYRQVAILLAKVFKSRTLGKIVTSGSSIFLCDDLYNRPIHTLVNLILLEGIPDIQHLRQIVQTQVIQLTDPNTGDLWYPEAQQNISYWMGFSFWRKLKNIDLTELIHYHASDIVTHEEALKTVKGLLYKPYSKDKPLWEMIVLPNYIPDPKKSIGISPDKKYFVVALRIHHAVTDAFSILRLLQALSTTGDKLSFIEATDYTQQSNRSTMSKIMKNISIAFQMPFEMSQLAVQDAFVLNKWTKLEKANSKMLQLNCSKVISGGEIQNDKITTDIGRFACGASPNVPLSLIASIRTAHGVSGTAVLYAAIVGALKHTVFEQICEASFTVLIMTPLPLPGAKPKLRNHLTVGYFSVLMSIEDPVKRLRLIHKRLEAQKKSTIPLALAILLKMGGSLPYIFPLLGYKLGARGKNVIGISNVAGPKGEVDLAGYPLKDLMTAAGMCVGKNKSISISLISIGGNIRVSIGADKRILQSDDNANLFALRFLQELEILKTSANFEPETA